MIRPLATFGLCALIPCGLACTADFPTATGTSSGVASSSSSNGATSGASAGTTSGGNGTSTGTATGVSSSGSGTGAGVSAAASSSTGASATGTSAGAAASSTGTTGGIGPATSSSGGGKTATGSGTSGGTTGGTGDGGCEPACAGKDTCCDGNCVDLTRDTTNCGMCGMLCASGDYCASSACTPATCPQEGCGDGGCCGFQCCAGEDFCCLVDGPQSDFTCQQPDAGSCPPSCAPTCISRRDAKRDIQYLDETQLRTAEDQVLRIPLARFNYKWDAPNERRRLGFIIEDVAPNPGVVDEARGVVDLYGYTSLAVAALQEQAKEIERLRQQVDELQRRLDVSAPHRPRKHTP